MSTGYSDMGVIRIINIEQMSSLTDVAELRKQYIQSLGGRPEPFLEEVLSCSGLVYTVSYGGKACGYFCASPKRTLLQFYVTDPLLPHAQETFSEMLSGGYIEKALVLTRDRVALSIALEFSKEITIDSYVFDGGPYRPIISINCDDTVFRKADMSDAPAIRSACGDFHDFLHYTLEGSITTGDIYVLVCGATVLGTGVIGAKAFAPPYVDIGMCVNEAYRKKSVGTYIIAKLREECLHQGWVPGASCKYENTGSRKTLEKASKDRILRVMF